MYSRGIDMLAYASIRMEPLYRTPLPRAACDMRDFIKGRLKEAEAEESRRKLEPKKNQEECRRADIAEAAGHEAIKISGTIKRRPDGSYYYLFGDSHVIRKGTGALTVTLDKRLSEKSVREKVDSKGIQWITTETLKDKIRVLTEALENKIKVIDRLLREKQERVDPIQLGEKTEALKNKIRVLEGELSIARAQTLSALHTIDRLKREREGEAPPPSIWEKWGEPKENMVKWITKAV